MFNNIGQKIQGLARIITTIGIIFSILRFVVELIAFIPTAEYVSDEAAAATIIGMGLVLVVGCLLSWVVSFLLFGFGKLVENSDIIAGNSEYQIIRCEKCGSPLSPDSNFCIVCGNPKTKKQ